ncbi:hypothetical protein LMG18102_03610 [Ralstonia mannitolilytica]|nr:hypothetical protein LMG18102_03610 [Ralstonia mannitolilytica]
MAARQVALRAGRAVAALLVQCRAVALARCTLPARRGRDAGFALAVVQRADHDGLVDVVFAELDEHFLPDARQPLPAHAGTGLPLRDAHPAAASVVRALALLPRKAHADLAGGARVVFAVATGLGLSIGPDHDGTVHALRGGRRIQAAAIGLGHGGTPRAAGVAGAEQTGIAMRSRRAEQVGGGRGAFNAALRFLKAKHARPGFRRAGRRIESQRGIEAAQASPQRDVRVGRQVVDAAVLNQVHQQRIRAVNVLRQVWAVDDLQAGAAAQCAHRCPPREQQGARLETFHDLLGNALGVGGIRRQRWADRQIRIRAAGRCGETRRGMGAQALLAFRVPRGHGHAAGRRTAVAGELLDGIALFHAVRAVIADSAGRGRFRVLGQLRAVGKDQQRVAAVRLVVFNGSEAEARFGQQAGDEVIVGLPKLRDMGARAEFVHARFGAGGVAPRGIRRIRREHLLDDVGQRPVLEDLAVPLLRGQPEPRHDGQAIAREAAVCAELLCQADQARAFGLGAIGQRGDQRDALAEQRLERDACIGADGHHAPFEQLGERFTTEPGFHREVRERPVAFQRVEAARGCEEVLKKSRGVHSLSDAATAAPSRR